MRPRSGRRRVGLGEGLVRRPDSAARPSAHAGLGAEDAGVPSLGRRAFADSAVEVHLMRCRIGTPVELVSGLRFIDESTARLSSRSTLGRCDPRPQSRPCRMVLTHGAPERRRPFRQRILPFAPNVARTTIDHADGGAARMAARERRLMRNADTPESHNLEGARLIARRPIAANTSCSPRRPASSKRQ